MNEELMKELEQMSDADKKALLETQFPEEIEKAAEAELCTQDLADALYAYGAYRADRDLAELETESGELAKEASAEFDAAETEIVEAMDGAVQDLGLAEIEDPIEMHKQAQAAAGLILEGYADQFEKVAKKKSKEAPSKLEAIKGKLKGGLEAAKGAARKAGKGLMKHKKPLLAIAAGGAGLTGAALYAKKRMEKKASDLSVSELADEVMLKIASEDVVIDGIEKLAAKGAAKGLKSFMAGAKERGQAAYSVGKKYLKSHGKAMAGAGAAGAAAGVAAGRASKE